MQKFILISLALGLGLFLYLLQIDQISNEDFNIKKLKGKTEFIIKKSDLNNTDSSVKRSDIYAIIDDEEYKIFTFSGDDFHKLFKYQFSDPKYKIPIEALDAVTGTWIGNRYVFYILEKKDMNTGENYFDIYKAEYSTDDVSKLQFYNIKSIKEYKVDNTFEVKY